MFVLSFLSPDSSFKIHFLPTPFSGFFVFPIIHLVVSFLSQNYCTFLSILCKMLIKLLS